jgi:hypothetical protein
MALGSLCVESAMRLKLEVMGLNQIKLDNEDKISFRNAAHSFLKLGNVKTFIREKVLL